MNKLYTFLMLALLSVSALNVQADDGSTSTTDVMQTMPAAVNLGPTSMFFTALSNCVPGDYQEANPIASSYGPVFLKHHIVGMDKEGCQVMLTTPDGRDINCDFEDADLRGLNDPHFISGITTVKMKGSSDEAVKADTRWSEIKVDSCSF